MSKVYKLILTSRDLIDVKLSDFDRALLNDIEHGKKSKTPIADKLLGLEMIVRRIEENKVAVDAITNEEKGEVK